MNLDELVSGLLGGLKAQSHSVFGFSDIFADGSRAQLAPTGEYFTRQIEIM